MPINVRSLTVNSGNDKLGPMACREINALMSAGQSATDVMIINCQELQMNTAIAELRATLGEKFKVEASQLKQTRTKISEFSPLANASGIATIVVYNPQKVEAVNFSNTRNASGSNMNKGGQVVDLNFTSKDDSEKFTIQCTSGHLDSNSDTKRMVDWKAIKQNQYFAASSWQDLATKVPDMSVLGMDANTRDIDTTKNDQFSYESKWLTEGLAPSIAPMYLSSTGEQNFSAARTYKTDEDIHAYTDNKRRGYVSSGALDHVQISNHSTPANITSVPNKKYTEASVNIGLDLTNSKRDHHMIGSGNVELTKVDDFTKAKNYIAQQLSHSAPKLSEQVSALENTAVSKLLLVEVNNLYLSPQGKLSSKIAFDSNNASNLVEPWFIKDDIAQCRDKVEAKLNVGKVEINKAFKIFESFYKSNKSHTNDRANAIYENTFNQMATTRNVIASSTATTEDIKSAIEKLDNCLNEHKTITKDNKKNKLIDLMQKIMPELSVSLDAIDFIAKSKTTSADNQLDADVDDIFMLDLEDDIEIGSDLTVFSPMHQLEHNITLVKQLQTPDNSAQEPDADNPTNDLDAGTEMKYLSQ